MKNKKEWLIITALVMAIVMVVTVGMPLSVAANAREDYESAQEELNRIEKELSAIKDTKQKQQQEQKNAQTQINLVKNQLSSLNTQIAETSDALALKQAELDDKKADIKETDELFKSKLKAMYINGEFIHAHAGFVLGSEEW